MGEIAPIAELLAPPAPKIRPDHQEVSRVTVGELCRWYENSIDATIEARRLAERDRDYYDNKQWTSDEAAKIRKRGQPVLTKNRIMPKVMALRGTELQMRTDPKAYPREPGDEKGAEAATDALRYVADFNTFDQKKSAFFDNMVVEGFGGAVVDIGPAPKNEVLIRKIAWDRLFYDPYSSELDFSDAMYKGIVAWLDLDQASIDYGAEIAREAYECCSDTTDSTYEDKPRTLWHDATRKRMKVCEVYYLEAGKWMHCVYTRGKTLVGPEPSPYVDEDGATVCPIEMMSCYIDRDNARYGVVRIDISPQDEVNKRASKALHLISMRQTMGTRGAVVDVGKMKRELAKPDGHVEIEPGEDMLFKILDTNDMAQSNILLMQEAKSEIQSNGANNALQGRENGDASGRALQSRKESSLVELGPVFDNLRSWQRAIYRQAWLRIKQYWDAPKWVRVTDNEDNLKYVGLNQPTTQGELMLEKAKEDGASPEELQQLQQQLAMDPRAQTQALKNDVRNMYMDIIIADQPDVVTLQGETFEALVQMYTANPEKVPFEIVIEAAPLRSSVKEKILEKLAPNPQVVEMQQQMQQMMQQMQAQMAQVELAQKQAEVMKTQADAANAAALAKLNEAKTLTEQAKSVQTRVNTLDTLLTPTGTDAQSAQPPPGSTGDVGQAAADFAPGDMRNY